MEKIGKNYMSWLKKKKGIPMEVARVKAHGIIDGLRKG